MSTYHAAYPARVERITRARAERTIVRDFGADMWRDFLAHFGYRPAYRLPDVLDWLGF